MFLTCKKSAQVNYLFSSPGDNNDNTELLSASG